MKDTEIAAADKAGGPVIHVPIVLGSEPIIYNLPGVPKLQLDGPTLASIYLGKITKWSDPAIAALNTGAKLPDTDITVVHRSDSSGTSFVFTGYLSAVSPDWKSQVGQDKEPQWPVGEGAEKNDGVAAQVKGTVGAIGYVELAYALQNKIPFAALKNKAGEFVLPSLASTTAAGTGAQYPADLRFRVARLRDQGRLPDRHRDLAGRLEGPVEGGPLLDDGRQPEEVPALGALRRPEVGGGTQLRAPARGPRQARDRCRERHLRVTWTGSRPG